MSHYLNLLLLCFSYVTYTSAFNPMASLTRRNLLFSCASSVVCFKRPVMAEDVSNKPLTSAEMEEYNRLLKEASRIQSIIDANIKAANKTLEEDSFKLRIFHNTSK